LVGKEEDNFLLVARLYVIGFAQYRESGDLASAPEALRMLTHYMDTLFHDALLDAAYRCDGSMFRRLAKLSERILDDRNKGPADKLRYELMMLRADNEPLTFKDINSRIEKAGVTVSPENLRRILTKMRFPVVAAPRGRPKKSQQIRRGIAA
jgi:hypothetical protein